jgi:thymidine kinase
MSSHKKGSLEVICGPMFSGKSEELIRRLRRATIAQQSVIVFKPSIDNRHATEYVVSHNGTRIPAFPIDDLNTILEHGLNSSVHVIGFDEVQFFDNGIVPVICTLIEAGKRILVAGLDLDFRGAPFGSMPLLMAIADSVTKLQAICTICGDDASFTQRLVDGQAARHDDPIILVGAQEAYQARCRQCYTIDKQPSFYHMPML